MKKILYIITLVIGALVGASVLSTLAAGTWTPAPSSPPSNNVDAPINVSKDFQEKIGSLLIDNNVGILGNLIVATSTGVGTKGKVLTAVDDSGTVMWTSTSSLGITGGGATGTSTPVSSNAFRVYQNTPQTLVNGNSYTMISWDSKNFDDGANLSLPTSRFTPKVAGRYSLSATVSVNGTAANNYSQFVVAIFKNGSIYALGNNQVIGMSWGYNMPSRSVSTVVDANVGDYFEVGVLQTFGVNIVTNTGDNKSHFSGFLIDGSGIASGVSLPPCTNGQTLQIVSGSWACVTPSGGSGGVTSLTAGMGITLSTTTGNVTISANTTQLQTRVTGVCPSGQAVKSVNADGTVNCVAMPASAICTFNGRTYSTGAICRQGAACTTNTVYYNGYQCSSTGAWVFWGNTTSCALTDC